MDWAYYWMSVADLGHHCIAFTGRSEGRLPDNTGIDNLTEAGLAERIAQLEGSELQGVYTAIQQEASPAQYPILIMFGNDPIVPDIAGQLGFQQIRK